MNSDFSKGKVWKNIIEQAIPLTIAEFVHLLYNIVDRIYIGHLDIPNNMALTGIGLTFPVVALIAAFTALYGRGGTPLFSMARGAKDETEAEKIMGNSFTLLVVTSFVLFFACYCFRRPILYLFGASDASYQYANEYLQIYILGTPFAMITTGMNGFINAQGFPKIGMMTTILGAVLNLILDPVFIFGFNMDVQGAAIATVISQVVSAIWVICFLKSKRAIVTLKRSCLKVEWKRAKSIMTLGASGFIVQGTNCLVQAVCNVTLQSYGGDLYVGIMTVLNSVREILGLPVMGITNGSQPVLGYNYGAKRNDRVKEGIRFTAIIGTIYTVLMWAVVALFPKFLCQIFTVDPEVLEKGPGALNIYFFGFFFMSFQFAGQTVFQALGKSKQAIFFSLLRKAVIVVPLTVLLPQTGMGVNGVFWAEPISNAIGGIFCFTAMWYSVYRKL